MTSTAYDDQFAECTPEEEEAFKAIEARQAEVSAQRKAGWYWVKVTAKWEPAYFDGLEFTLDHGPIAKLGSRIPTPDESISRKKKASVLFEVAEKLGKYYDPCVSSGMRHMAYQLEAAAPKPEDS